MISLKSIGVNEFNKKPIDSTSLKRSVGVKLLVLDPGKAKTGRSLEPKSFEPSWATQQGPVPSVSENRKLLRPLVNGSNVNQK